MNKKYNLYVPEDSGYFKNFPGHNRLDFPQPLVRVTGGDGGEAILILGSEKTALHDCGMACFSDRLIENIKCVLGEEGRTIDYILLSHTHYDHIGALPYILKEWPEAVVCANPKAASVFTKPGAKATMERLGNKAKDLFGIETVEITAEGLRVDRILEDGDEISLGKEKVIMYDAKGHTDCSVAYYILPQKILFTSESTGVIVSEDLINPSVLKSYQASIESARKLKLLDAEWIVALHYGVLPQSLNSTYFDRYIEIAMKEYELVSGAIKRGLDFEEVLEEHKKAYWNEERNRHQPFDAYRINAEATVKVIKNELNG